MSQKNAGSTGRSRAASDIVAALEKDILGGSLAPGQRVDEIALGRRFSVSRTPVREALLELAAIGLVEQRAHRGAFVAEVTLEQIFDVYEVLAELEGLCARLASRRMDDQERRQLRQLHAQMGRLVAREHRARYIALDEAFHRLLVDAARNAALRDHIAMCMRKIAPVRQLSMELAHDLATAYAEHSALLEAVLSGDGPGAQRIMCEHVALRAEQAKDLAARWKTRPQAAA